MRFLKNSIFAAALAAALAAGVFLTMRFGPTDDEKREVVVKVLGTVPRSFLVVLTQESLVVTHRRGGNWYLGKRRGQSSMVVRVHWGVDLAKVGRTDIAVSGNRVVVRLPAPEILDQAPDLDTWRYVTKRSGLQVIRDAARGRSLERELLRDVQNAFPHYRPADFDVQRLAILDRLNRSAASLFAGTGLDVRFE
jgi:hypothetical protein